MKLITCAAALALTIMSCQKKSSDDAQPAPNKVEEAKGEAPSTPVPSTPSTSTPSTTSPETPVVVVQLNKYEAYVAENFADESKEDQKMLATELEKLDIANPSQDLSVFKQQLTETLKISNINKGRAFISQLIAARYSEDLDAQTQSDLLAEFEAWMSVKGISSYSVESFDAFMTDHSA